MRDTFIGSAGNNRMLLAIAATLLVASSTAVLAQSTGQSAPKSAAELAIDSAVPMPEPANVPPPTATDFKLDSVAHESAVKPDAPAVAATEPEKKDTAAIAPAQVASAVPATEQPIADKLRDLIGSQNARFFGRKNERAAIEAFYKGRDYAPLLTQGGVANARAKAAIGRLKDVGGDGLDPADYPTPNFSTAGTPDAQAEAELKLMASILDYARHAESGRMHWSQVSASIQYPQHQTDPAEVIANIAAAKDVVAALDSYNPKHKGYLALKAKLAELRGKIESQAALIPNGPALKFVPARKKQAAVSMEDPRVPQLRARLGIADNASDTHYDEKVASVVRKFQQSNDLQATGILDAPTIRALNSPKKDRQIDVVRVNMERWRWLPRDLGSASLGDAYVILNIPNFSLSVMQNGAPLWTTRVVTGKPGAQATPLLSETMKYITVNPTWNVPPSIVSNEYLPALQQDPTVLQRMGLRLERDPDGGIRISQPPGEANALGRIRFNFPNKFLVYQHDTPDKHLFARDERAFSHGCMRVQNPDQYAATLLSIAMPNGHYTAEKIRSMYGRSEIDIKFPTPIPVNITYQTAFVDEAGKLEFRKDIYGRDSQMIALLRGNNGKDLESVVAHAQPSYARPKGDVPQGVAFNGDSYGGSPPSFLERLFGGGPSALAPPQQRQIYTR